MNGDRGFLQPTLVLSVLTAGLAWRSGAWAGTPPVVGVLEFLDGASLHGRLRSMGPERGVAWEHPEAKQVIEFRPANLASIVFDNVKPIETPSKPTCRFRF